MERIKVKITLLEDILGTATGDPEIYESYIGDKAPNAQSLTEEIEALGENEVIEKGMTIFPRDEDGDPIMWDYQIKGFFKDACGMLARVKTTESSKIKAYKKIIDGLVFVEPRKIKINVNGEITTCQRPLRASTAQGERIALAMSESIPAGSWFETEIVLLDPGHEDLVREWLDYGVLRGLGQWRNSGKGRFSWEAIE